MLGNRKFNIKFRKTVKMKKNCENSGKSWKFSKIVKMKENRKFHEKSGNLLMSFGFHGLS